MDGDVAPLGRARRARAAPRLPADGRRGARRRRARARAAAARSPRPASSGEVDVVDRHARQGARQLRRLRCACGEDLRELLVNTARPFIFSTAPPPPAVGAARWPRSTLLAESDRLVDAPAPPTRRRCATALARRGPRRRRLDDADRPARRRRRRPRDARSASGRSSAASSPRRSGPPTVPDGHLAPAPRR